MYTLLRESTRGLTSAPAGVRRRVRLRGVGRTVVLLGLVSMFTDISAEMVNSVLPLYLIVTLGFSPVQFGVLDGVYQGASAVVRLASGFVADRFGKHKDVAVVGYGMSVIARVALLLIGGSFAALGSVLLLDRTGKGIRTAPRDAMISLNAPTESLGLAFGVHRALDTVGALVGPVIAFAILTIAPRAFSTIFTVSLSTAVVGLAILVLFVQNRTADAAPREAASPTREPRVSLRAALGSVREPHVARLIAVGTLLSLTTISDSFIFLVLRRQLDLRFGLFPLLYVGTALVYFLLAVPIGWLADRVGRGMVFVGGYVLLLGVYLTALNPPAIAAVSVPLALLGGFYAATDGVLTAQASALLPERVRTSGLAALTTATSLGRFGGSILFGALWTWQGAERAVGIFLAGLIAALLVAAMLIVRPPRSLAHE